MYKAQIKLFQSVCLLLALVLALIVPSYASDMLNVHVSPFAKTNENARFQVYQRLLNHIYTDKYTLSYYSDAILNQLARNGQLPDNLYLGHRPPNKSWLRSSLNVGVTDTVYVIYDKHRVAINQLSDLQALRISSPLNPLWMQVANIATKPIPISDLMSVDRLISNNKIDAVVLAGEQVYLANHEHKFQVDVLMKSQPIYVYFPNTAQGLVLKQRFDQQFLALNQSGKIKEIFANDALLAKANINTENIHASINWHFVPKIYDPNTNELKVSTFELAFTEKLKKLLPEYQLSTRIVSGRMAQQKLSGKQPVCVLNAMNIQDKSLYKSHVTYHFLPPQLYHHQSIKQSHEKDREADLQSLLSYNSSLVIGAPSGAITKKIAEFLPAKHFQRIKVFEPLKYQQMVNMFLAKRIDAIIIWPSLLQELLPKASSASQLQSQRLPEHWFSDIPAFIACNATPLHKEFIEQINNILEHDASRNQLFSSYFKGLDKATHLRLQQKLLLE